MEAQHGSKQSSSTPPRLVANDTAAYQGWQSIPNYQSNNPQFVTDAVMASRAAPEAAQAAEVQVKAVYDAACAHTGKAEFNFHSVMLGVKDQVIAQFGRDSDEY
jgi:hypothetical protein